MELKDVRVKIMARELKKCSKCKFNNYFGDTTIGFRFSDYCHAYEKCITRRFWCRYFEKVKKKL